MFNKFSTRSLILAGSLVAITVATAEPSVAQDMRKRPSLTITNRSLPSDQAPTGSVLYNNRVRTPGMVAAPTMAPASGGMTPMATADIPSAEIGGASYYQPTETIVGQKVSELRTDLSNLQGRVSALTAKLKSLKETNVAMATEYNASVATINTQLQSGTTPGNPRLVQRLSVAQGNLDKLSQNVADLNGMAVEAANAASMGSYLLDACRSAYGLSGAVEEDHAALDQLEDQINTTVVSIDRVLNDVNDDITRTAAYLSSERNNLRTMSLAVTNGDYYGRSLANRPFSNAPQTNLLQPASMSGGVNSVYPSSGAAGGVYPSPAPVSAGPSSPRPLVKIKFDRPDVDYTQAVYTAVSEAFQKYPNARLELIAVHPSQGNAAQVAIESTRSRRNAENVLRSLSQMGVDVSKIDLSTSESADAKSNEVQIYIR